MPIAELVHRTSHPMLTRSQYRADYFTLTDYNGVALGAGPFHFVCRLARERGIISRPVARKPHGKGTMTKAP